MKNMLSCAVVVVLMSCVVSFAAPTYLVELGTPVSEAGFNIQNWGPIEPTTSEGSWGGIATDPGSYDHLARTVWGANDADWASVSFDSSVNSVTIRHLDGGADDGFNVYVNDVLWGSYADSGTTETWKMTTFTGAPGTVLKIQATGQPWALFCDYGQLGIDRIEACAVPVPGAILLAGIGAGAVGFMRKKRILG
jgi:hypothetical protein